MAKRKRLEAPSTEQLRRIEEEIEQSAGRGIGRGALPPIAAVAGEAAAQNPLGLSEQRADLARDTVDAERYRQALADGMVVQKVALADIAADELHRDRIVTNSEEMDELKASIMAHGLRLPIEISPRPTLGAAEPYGLISGWRRLMAMRALYTETGDESFAHIRAILRKPDTVGDAYIAMVEENEIRSDLSHYERGRIAVQATRHGVFNSVEAAVNALFHAASKAKRSKIRGFAELHIELGELLSFPTHLSERQGLRVVAAIRCGYADDLRHALETGTGTDPATEWGLLEQVVTAAEAQARKAPRPKTKGGRPPRRSNPDKGYYKLSNGVTLEHGTDSRGHVIRIQGPAVTAEQMEGVLLQIKRLLEPI